MNKLSKTFTFNVHQPNSAFGAGKKVSQLNDEDLELCLQLLSDEMTVREDAKLEATELLRCADVGGWEDAISCLDEIACGQIAPSPVVENRLEVVLYEKFNDKLDLVDDIIESANSLYGKWIEVETDSQSDCHARCERQASKLRYLKCYAEFQRLQNLLTEVTS